MSQTPEEMKTKEEILAAAIIGYNHQVNDMSKFKLNVTEFEVFTKAMQEYGDLLCKEKEIALKAALDTLHIQLKENKELQQQNKGLFEALLEIERTTTHLKCLQLATQALSSYKGEHKCEFYVNADWDGYSPCICGKRHGE